MKWLWPLPGIENKISQSPADSRFGGVRKYDMHTGQDLYCDPSATVIACEDGVVAKVEIFTGPRADSPWWNETHAVLVEGVSGTILYGEIIPAPHLTTGTVVKRGDTIGAVATVLKEDKGRPMTMLHLELYTHNHEGGCWWKLGEPQPATLLDPTQHLLDSE